MTGRVFLKLLPPRETLIGIRDGFIVSEFAHHDHNESAIVYADLVNMAREFRLTGTSSTGDDDVFTLFPVTPQAR
jgi:hypothetical protein